jgi:hypothetical protein
MPGRRGRSKDALDWWRATARHPRLPPDAEQTGASYPIRHARGANVRDALARFETPPSNELEAIYQDGLAHLERLFRLHDRVQGRLIGIAERVEAEGAEVETPA